MMDGSGFRVRLLGLLEVRQDGQLLGPGPSALKPRALLTILAVDANRVVSKDALVDRLWEVPPPTARNLVEKHVGAWRRVLDERRLETIGPGYRLNLADDECDLLEARRCLAVGQRATRVLDWRGASTAFSAALRLWPAGFDHTLASLLPEPEVLRLVELQLTTVEEWAHAVLRSSGPSHELIEVLRETLQLHPLKERVAELLMWALSGNGDQQGALACYDRIRQTLADELGQDPGEALQAMQVRVLRHDAHLLPPARHVGVESNMPSRNGRFVGREHELEAVTASFRSSPGGPMRGRVALCGLVGAGKSALAIEYAHRNRDHYECVWWVDATTGTGIAAGLEALAGRLGCELPAERQPSLGQLWDRLALVEGALLILDNAESASELRDYLPPVSAATVLITSLNPDWRQLANVVTVDVLSPADSRRFIRGGIGEVDEAVETELIAALGRLPLAMSQAAAYITQTGMPATSYVQLFRRRRGQLLRRGAPDDHRGTIETLWRLARAELSASDPAAVQLLAMCSVLAAENIPVDVMTRSPALMPDELAAAIRDEVNFEDAIRQLRRYSLMVREGHTVQVHCLVQAVVMDSLSVEEADVWRERAAAALQAAAPDGLESRERWPRWDVLVPHIREIARAARSHPFSDAKFIDLTHAASAYLVIRGQYSDAVALMRDSHALTGAVAPSADDAMVGRSLTLLGEAMEQQGMFKEALDAQERAVQILQTGAEPDDPWLARAMAGLGSVLTCHSGVSLWKPTELEEAEARFVHALTVLTAAFGEHSPIVARLHAALGQVRQDRGDLAGGRDCLERALTMLEAVLEPGHPEIGHCCDKLAYVLALCGDTERSLSLYERAEALLTDSYHPDHMWVAWSLSNRAMLLNSIGRHDAALKAQARAHAMFLTGAGDSAAVPISAWRLARIHATTGCYDEAVSVLTPAVASAARLLGPEHGDVLAMKEELGRLLASRGLAAPVTAIREVIPDAAAAIVHQTDP